MGSSRKMQIMVEIGVPATTPADQGNRNSIEDRVKEAIECIESGYDSSVEWLMIRKIYDSLRQMKKTRRVRNLINMIEPTLNKYGYYSKDI